MKSMGHVFLLLGLVFLVLSFTGNQSPALGLAFIALGIIYSAENEQNKHNKPKGNP